MDSVGYGKTGRITLVGFLIFSLLVIWVVNTYFVEEKKFLQREVDTQMSKNILLDTYNTNQILIDMEKSLSLQKEWLKSLLSAEKETNNTNLPITYLNNENVSIIDADKLENPFDIGSIIINGNWSELDSDIKLEINHMSELFKLEKVLNEKMDFPMNSIYYSKNNYVTFYPYLELGKRQMDYNKIFTSVDGLIAKVKDLDKTDSSFNLEEGWNQATIDSSKKVTLSSTLPIIIEDEIVGMLTGSINEDSYSAILKKDLSNTDIFIADANNSIIYTSNKNCENLSDINEVFLEQYSVKYYQNKFPIQLEIRREKEYTLYITQLAKEKWYLIYVVDNLEDIAGLKLFAFNFIMVVMLFGIVYYAIRFDSINRINIESIIKNAQNDSMTELLNHKYIMDALKKFVKYRRIRQLAVMMLDLDDFKTINDTYGHAIGDQVIHSCADVLKNELLSNNCIAGRYGGEEFLFITLRASKEESFELAERIRVKVHEMIYEKTGLNVTISIGVYHVTKPIHLSAVDLVNEADRYLYEAKNAGKNQVQGGSNS